MRLNLKWANFAVYNKYQSPVLVTSCCVCYSLRIENTEVRNSGQAFRLGRYSIHFHLSASMAGSYVRACSIHHTFNRAITAHGVHDLIVEGNVAYDVMGHTYFVVSVTAAECGNDERDLYCQGFPRFVKPNSV